MLKKPPKQVRSRRMVDDILAGAARVLASVPLEAATTNRIAAVAGVSIGSLYQYFDSKERIAASLLRRHCDEAVGTMRESRLASRGYGTMKRLQLPFAEFLCEHRRHAELHRAMGKAWENLRLFDRATIECLDRTEADLVDEVAQLLREERPAAGDGPIRLCATLYCRNAMLLTHAFLAQGNPPSDRIILEQFERVVAASLHGLADAA